MKLKATEAHLERAIPAVKAEPRSHTTLCLFAQAINDAVAPRTVELLCPTSGRLSDGSEFFIPDDVMRKPMQYFDNEEYSAVKKLLPYDFEIVITGEQRNV